jgi:hypothetical protein
MVRRSSRDTQFLELHGGKWRVTIAVPRDLARVLGTRLKRSLNTDSLTLANRLKPRVVAELRARIDLARDQRAGKVSALLNEAVELSQHYANISCHDEMLEVTAAIREREDEIVGGEIGQIVDPETGEAAGVYDASRVALAQRFGAIARGRATPVDLHHAKYLDQLTVKARTRNDDLRAIRFLREWCERERIPFTLEEVTRKRAVQFMDSFKELSGGADPVTQNKYLGRLSRYWRYLALREHVKTDVWAELKVPAPESKHDEQEREFTDDEIRRLLTGSAPPKLMDVMMIGALSGARLDAIVDLKVKDTIDGCFTFKPQKKERAPRDVPIHPGLVELVRRRTDGKGPDEDLFPEWPGPKKAGSVRERSFKTSNAFTAYRRSVGVDQIVEGKRRALVNFHSFRRWFITKAERANQNGDIIAAVVGHKRSGITLGRYSGGPEMKQARRCVASVKLPPLDGRKIVESKPVLRRRID